MAFKIIAHIFLKGKLLGKRKRKSEQMVLLTKNTDAGLSSYKTVWQYPDSNYPEQEFEVKSISDKEVKFDYTIDGITSFENVSAPINGNTANFDIKNEGDWNIKGTITFSDNKVVFNIKESSTENIPVNSTTFTVKSNKSAY